MERLLDRMEFPSRYSIFSSRLRGIFVGDSESRGESRDVAEYSNNRAIPNGKILVKLSLASTSRRLWGSCLRNGVVFDRTDLLPT